MDAVKILLFLVGFYLFLIVVVEILEYFSIKKRWSALEFELREKIDDIWWFLFGTTEEKEQKKQVLFVDACRGCEFASKCTHMHKNKKFDLDEYMLKNMKRSGERHPLETITKAFSDALNEAKDDSKEV